MITERDYHTIHKKKALLIQQLSSSLAVKTFLFIGYSASDPDFNQIYDLLHLDLDRHQRRHYLVTFDLDEWEKDDLEQRGFRIIIPPGTDDLNARLGRWLQALEGDSLPPDPEPGAIDYEKGLDILRERLANSDRYLDFTTLETRLRENLHDEQFDDIGENIKPERARIVASLNRLALNTLGVPFTDLAMGRSPDGG